MVEDKKVRYYFENTFLMLSNHLSDPEKENFNETRKRIAKPIKSRSFRKGLKTNSAVFLSFVFLLIISRNIISENLLEFNSQLILSFTGIIGLLMVTHAWGDSLSKNYSFEVLTLTWDEYFKEDPEYNKLKQKFVHSDYQELPKAVLPIYGILKMEGMITESFIFDLYKNENGIFGNSADWEFDLFLAYLEKNDLEFYKIKLSEAPLLEKVYHNITYLILIPVILLIFYLGTISIVNNTTTESLENKYLRIIIFLAGISMITFLSIDLWGGKFFSNSQKLAFKEIFERKGVELDISNYDGFIYPMVSYFNEFYEKLILNNL